MTTEQQNIIFDRWVSEHAGLLHHVANGFAEGADRHDLMQQVLLAVWRAVPAFREGAHPSTFIYRVAHNAALTWRRSETSYRRKLDRYAAEAMENHPPADDSGLDGREGLEHLYVAIRKLPVVERSILLLHLDGLAYGEIAEIHGLSVGAVGVRLTRLKQKLTALLASTAEELR